MELRNHQAGGLLRGESRCLQCDALAASIGVSSFACSTSVMVCCRSDMSAVSSIASEFCPATATGFEIVPDVVMLNA